MGKTRLFTVITTRPIAPEPPTGNSPAETRDPTEERGRVRAVHLSRRRSPWTGPGTEPSRLMVGAGNTVRLLQDVESALRVRSLAKLVPEVRSVRSVVSNFVSSVPLVWGPSLGLSVPECLGPVWGWRVQKGRGVGGRLCTSFCSTNR